MNWTPVRLRLWVSGRVDKVLWACFLQLVLHSMGCFTQISLGLGRFGTCVAEADALAAQRSRKKTPQHAP